jgi:hypothetical protein
VVSIDDEWLMKATKKDVWKCPSAPSLKIERKVRVPPHPRHPPLPLHRDEIVRKTLKPNRGICTARDDNDDNERVEGRGGDGAEVFVVGEVDVYCPLLRSLRQRPLPPFAVASSFQPP